MSSCTYNIVFLTMVLLETIPASPLERHRRFMTPTTYPVPTIPINNLLGGSALVTSVPVRCPLKREADDRMRVILDDDLMRQIYLTEVGSIDTRYLAETMADARTTFHRSRPERFKKTNLVRDAGLLKHIKDWISSSNTNRTRSPENGDTSGQHGLTDEQKRPNNFDNQTESFTRNKRVRRNVDGSVSTLEYCTARGKTTSDGYMHMCTSCALTTVLPETRFPRYINEVDCDSTDCECFNVRGTANGKCKTRIHHVKMLRKIPNGCRLTIHSGQQVITDNWEIYDHPLRVGCECVINKLSVFATFIPKPSG